MSKDNRENSNKKDSFVAPTDDSVSASASDATPPMPSSRPKLSRSDLESHEGFSTESIDSDLSMPVSRPALRRTDSLKSQNFLLADLRGPSPLSLPKNDKGNKGPSRGM
jgi:hypothetical protein